VIKLMAQNSHPIKDANILMLGITFKENCPDIRNSKVVDVIRELESFGTQVDIYDPEADNAELEHEYGLSLIKSIDKKYHAVVLAVSHQQFATLNWKAITHEHAVIYDVKGFLKRDLVTARL
jgi:UDP-N-acetyl-D-glucosamine/UDP-N-acetyl-D-galactosamine dehydrogenase